MANTFFIPVQQIKDSTYVDDNTSDNMIKIAILDAQEQCLEPVLGSLLYEKLIDNIKNQTVLEDYQLLLVNYIWKIMLQATVFMLSNNLLIRLTNSSIVKDSNENSSAISIAELKTLIYERKRSMNYHIKKLKDHLKAYPTKYPEYLGTPPIDGESPDLSENYLSIWDYDDDVIGAGPSSR